MSGIRWDPILFDILPEVKKLSGQDFSVMLVLKGVFIIVVIVVVSASGQDRQDQ